MIHSTASHGVFSGDSWGVTVEEFLHSLGRKQSPDNLRFVVVERPLSGKVATQITGRSSLDSCSCHSPETAISRSIRSPSHCDTQDRA